MDLLAPGSYDRATLAADPRSVFVVNLALLAHAATGRNAIGNSVQVRARSCSKPLALAAAVYFALPIVRVVIAVCMCHGLSV